MAPSSDVVIEKEKIYLKDYSIIRNRPKGRQRFLSSHVEELSIILGVSPSLNQIDAFEQFAEKSSQATDKRIPCLLQDDFNPIMIDDNICQWCSKNTACTFNNTKIDSLQITMHPKISDSDKEILRTFFEKKEFTKNKSRIFNHNIHPFKPLFGDLTKSLMLTPLGLFNKHPKFSHSFWAHLFYSPPLGRTLTMFEAMILDTISEQTQEFKLDRNKRFPTCGELSKWFEDEGRTDLQSSIIGELIERTKSLIYGGFDIPVELGFELTRESDLVDFSHSLIESFHQFNIRSMNNTEIPVAVERESCILLVPKNYHQEFNWASCVRILRIIYIDNLNDVFVLHHDVEIHELMSTDQDIDDCVFPPDFSSQKSFSCKEICDSIEKFNLPYSLIPWKKELPRSIPGKPDYLVLDWFKPEELFEAHYAHLFYRNKASTTGDETQLNHFDNLDNFVDRFYNITSMSENVSYDEKSLIEFKELYHSAYYRKMTPCEALTILCSSTNPVVHKFLHRSIYQFRTDHVDIETFSFRLDWHVDDQENYEPRQRLIEFTREIHNSGGVTDFEKTPFTVSKNDFSDIGPRQLRRICSALNHGTELMKENIIMRSDSINTTVSSGGLWISQSLMEVMDESISEHIAAQLKYYSDHRAMCCALASDLPMVKRMVGLTVNHVSTKRISSQNVVFWTVPSAASEFSPHFVFVGSNRRI